MSKAKMLIDICNEARMSFTDKAKTVTSKLKKWAKDNGWRVESSTLKEAYQKGYFVLQKCTETDPLTESDLIDSQEVWSKHRKTQVYKKYGVEFDDIQKLAETINLRVKEELEEIEREGGEAAQIIREAQLPVIMEHVPGQKKGIVVSFVMQRDDLVNIK